MDIETPIYSTITDIMKRKEYVFDNINIKKLDSYVNI